MKRFIMLVAAMVSKMARAIRNALRRARGIPPELDETAVEQVADEALAPDHTPAPMTLGDTVLAWLNYRLHGGPLPDMTVVPEAARFWLEGLTDAEAATAVGYRPASLERHVAGDVTLLSLPRVESVEMYHARREAAIQEALREEDELRYTVNILQDLVDDIDTVDTFVRKAAA